MHGNQVIHPWVRLGHDGLGDDHDGRVDEHHTKRKRLRWREDAALVVQFKLRNQLVHACDNHARARARQAVQLCKTHARTKLYRRALER